MPWRRAAPRGDTVGSECADLNRAVLNKAASGKLAEAEADIKFAVHRWSKNKANEVIERDLQQSLAFIVFAEEVGAREVEKTLQNAKAFCASKQRQ